MKKRTFYPDEIIFSVTEACNLHCPHCYVNRSPARLDINKAKEFIISSVPNVRKIGFSGGEPFLYQDFLFEIIPFAIKQDLLFDQIMTNGDWWPDTNTLENTLTKLYNTGYDGKIGLSWDSFHNQSTERMKTFIDTVHQIFGDDSLNIQFVVPFNEGESTPLASASQLSSATPPAGTPRNAPITAEEIQTIFPQVPVYQLPQCFCGSDTRAWTAKKWFKDDYCAGPGQILYIHPNGKIAPCCGFANENNQLIIGTIDESFQQIMENAYKNPLIKLCYTDGLTKAIRLLKKQKTALPGKCQEICSFCDFVCKNLKT